MRPRTVLIATLAVAVLAGAACILLISAKPPRRAGNAVAPYYQRTGFLSNLLQELDTSPRGLESIHIPDGFEVSLAATPGLVTYPMFITLHDRGRLFVCESAGRNISDQEMEHQSEMRIRLEDTDGDGVYDRSTIFADKISMTMGAQWYRGSLYVAAPPDVLRFEDTDGDGIADRREVVPSGWPLRSNGTAARAASRSRRLDVSHVQPGQVPHQDEGGHDAPGSRRKSISSKRPSAVDISYISISAPGAAVPSATRPRPSGSSHCAATWSPSNPYRRRGWRSSRHNG
jgi:hypothetical protein